MVLHKAAVLTAALLLPALPSPVLAVEGSPGDGYQVRTFRSSVDGSDQPYALYLPKVLASGRQYPLVISLHGAGGTHRNGIRQVFGVPAAAPLPEVEYIVAAPLARGSMGYEGIAETDVFDTLAHVKAAYPVDANRVYLTGVSMGGSGTLSIALRRPDTWAAIAVVCGGAPSGTVNLAANALNIPVHLFHGDQDAVVPVEVGRRWHELFRQAGVQVAYREFPGEGHNIAPLAYRNGSIFEWFSRHQRAAAPQRVRFATDRHAYNAAYWVRADSFEPGQLATVDATLRDGELTVTTSRLDSLTFDPPAGSAKTLNIDGTTLQPSPGPIHVGRSADGVWELLPEPRQHGKRPQRDGPLASLLATQHAYVYGTIGSSPDELWARQEVAQRAADWSGRRARPAVSLAVLSDTEAANAPGNLVLFGTAQTNRLLRQWSPELPLALKQEAASGYGLVFLAPVAGRMVLVSAGLPWWTSPSREQQESFRWQWLSLPYRLANEWPDFVLFQGSVRKIVAMGTFTRDWMLSSGDTAKLLATGVITVTPRKR